MKIADNNQTRPYCKQHCKSHGQNIQLRYGIIPNTLISVKHLIALQLYCNTTVKLYIICAQKCFFWIKNDVSNKSE